MTREMELHCRDELRAARSAVLRDSEAYSELLFAIERTGAAARSNKQPTILDLNCRKRVRCALTPTVARSRLT